MTYRIHYTLRAKNDLRQALGHIKFSLQNPQAAQSLLNETKHILAGLSSMPKRYPLADDPLLAAWGVRFVAVKNHLAFYVVDDEAQTVHVVRFLYGRSDWRSVLRLGYSLEQRQNPR